MLTDPNHQRASDPGTVEGNVVSTYLDAFAADQTELAAQGMRVLDLGCGAGDVAILAAELVGPTGPVVGIDRNADVIARQNERARSAGLRNVEFSSDDQSNQPLSDIAQSSGFLDYAHFFRKFRARFGHPPSRHLTSRR
jgi:SAM-dependent methyltransferase